MTRYYFLDECGDPGLNDNNGASSHLVYAIVELAKRGPLDELKVARSRLYLPPRLEFKFNRARPHQKEIFFASIQNIPFRIRIAVIDKSKVPLLFRSWSGAELTIGFISQLILRASDTDIANDVLIIDGAIPSLVQKLRIRLTTEWRKLERVRLFKTKWMIFGKSFRQIKRS